MSLINDALKRAKTAHLTTTPADLRDLELRPAEAAKKPRRLGPMLTGMLILTGLLWLLVIYQMVQKNDPAPGSPEMIVEAREALPPTPAEEPPLQVIHSEPIPFQPPAQTLPPTSLPLPDTTVTNTPPETITVAVMPSAETIPPGPAALRLQGVVAHPRRPFAMISGRTLFIGDSIDGMKLVKLTSRSAFLVGDDGQNLLLRLAD